MDWCLFQDPAMQKFSPEELRAKQAGIKRKLPELRASWGGRDGHPAVSVTAALASG